MRRSRVAPGSAPASTCRLQRFTVAVLVGGLSAAGCGGGVTGGAGTRTLDAAEVADRYGYDLASSELTPVYALIPEYNDPRDGHARDLLARRCLEGVVEYEPIQLGEQANFSDERTRELIFDEQVAAQWGYSAQRLHPISDGAAINNVTTTPAVSEAMQQCGREADERFGTPPQLLPNDVQAAGWDALATSDELDATVARWRECMEPGGVIDLPPNPHEMPSPSVVTPGSQVEENGGLVGTDVLPSAREIEVALLDARCRDESGFTETEFRVRATAELEAIGRNLEEFDAVREEYRRYGEGVDDVIAELG